MMKTLKYLLGLLSVVLFAMPAEAAASAPEPMIGKAVKVGSFSVVPLQDGVHNFSIKLFKGESEEKLLHIAGTGNVPGSFNVFLITHGKQRFLVDSGNGTLVPERKGQLLQCLQKVQCAPQEISKIFITHLHADHIGGLVANGVPTFPKAKVYIAKKEYDYWMDDASMLKAPEDRRGLFAMVRNVMRVLDQKGLVVFFTPGDQLIDGLTSVALYGHTPGHVGFMLASEGKKFFFVGDLLHGAAVQLARPDITVSFDVDQAMAKETRLRVFKELAKDGTTPIATAHLPFPGIGLVQVAGEGYRLTELP